MGDHRGDRISQRRSRSSGSNGGETRRFNSGSAVVGMGSDEMRGSGSGGGGGGVSGRSGRLRNSSRSRSGSDAHSGKVCVIHVFVCFGVGQVGALSAVGGCSGGDGGRGVVLLVTLGMLVLVLMATH